MPQVETAMSRTAKRVLTICLVVILGPPAYVIAWFWWASYSADQFYRARPVLQSMKRVHDGRFTQSSVRAREVLLQHIPLGAGEADARAVLSREDFGCGKLSASYVLDCQLLAKATLGYTRWIIDFQFDSTGHLVDAKVAIWNIFL
jgi:hypothetical protein